MSKLKQKSIRMVIKIYAVVVLLGIILSFFLLFIPLKDQALAKLNDQNSYAVEEADAALKTLKEYANYVAYSKDMLENLKTILENPENTENTVNRYNLSSTIYYLSQVKQGVRSIAISGKDIPTIYSLIEPSENEKNALKSDWYGKIKSSAYGSGFSNGIYAENDSGSKTKVIAYSSNYNIKGINFILTVFYNYNEIFGRLNRYKDEEFSEHSLLNSNREPIFPLEEELHIKQILREKSEVNDMVYTDDSGIYIFKAQLEGSYVSVIYLSRIQFYITFIEYILTITVLLLVFLGISIWVVLRIIDQITKPIFELSKSMKYAVDKDLSVQIEFDSDDEIGELSDTFNRMMFDIKNHIAAIIKQEEKEQEMKFGLLISQVDPHFICNTLSTVNYLARQNRTEDIIVISTALSNMLRDRLRLKHFQIYDTVFQEVETVKQYLTIQEYRYGHGVQVQWMVESELNYAVIPKNIIQPLVENSLFHGLADEDTGVIEGTIKIEIGKTKQGLVIKVQDNGRGMDDKKIRKIYQMQEEESEGRGHGIGIQGVVERLEILYHNNFELKIISEIKKGTTVLIEIAKEIEKNEDYRYNN